MSFEHRPARRRRQIPARAITYTVVALLAVAAIEFTKPMPEAERKPAEVLAMVTPADTLPALDEQVDTLGRGESLVALLERGGLGDEAADVVGAAPVDERRIPAGMPVIIRKRGSDSLPSEVVFQLAVDRLVHLTRTDSGWVGSEEKLPWTTDTMVVSGTIRSTLYEALDEGAPQLPRRARAELAWSLADILEYRVDMSRDLQQGDSFRVMFERSTGPGGATKIDRILATTFSLSGTDVEAFHYLSKAASGEYFDQYGKSLRAAFLRAPVEFRRISSVFGLRKHPILGIWRAHKGTDYAAARGTPVRAIGDGTVVRAGVYRGYGNCLEIRHRNGYVSRYGHLQGFARGVRVGQLVTVGQTVGYVGSTGLATGPHLHFEMLIGGQQRDSRQVLASLKGGDPIPARERTQFAMLRGQLLSLLEHPGAGDSVPTRVATGP